MLKTSESAGMKHAERHPVRGVVLTKITLEGQVIFVRLVHNSALLSLGQSLLASLGTNAHSSSLPLQVLVKRASRSQPRSEPPATLLL